MNIVALLLILILGGCAPPRNPPQLSVDPEFQPYLDEFIQESKNQGRPVEVNNLSIQFVNTLPSETLGQCFSYNDGGDGTPIIIIDWQDWQIETPDYKKIVLFHELGHCVLWRQHIYTFNGPAGDVTSIMYPYILHTTTVYTDNWDYYMHEMFYQ